MTNERTTIAVYETEGQGLYLFVQIVAGQTLIQLTNGLTQEVIGEIPLFGAKPDYHHVITANFKARCVNASFGINVPN